MKITDYVENDDGSASLALDLTYEEQLALIEFAVTELLKRRLTDETDRKDNCSL